MNVKSIEKPEINVVELTIEVGKEEFDHYVNQAYLNNKKQISVPGFRKGKAPRKIIENIYGSSVFYEDAIDLVLPTAFDQAITQENIKVVDNPHIELVNISAEDGFVFKAKVTVYPEVELGQYKGLKAEREKPEVSDADIEKEMGSLQRRNARLVSVSRPIVGGDIAIIDFDGRIDGAPFEGGTAEKYSLDIGSGSFIPGFEEQLAGLTAGEEKELELTFPENYDEKFAGKPVTFKVKVLEVKERVLPELDDEFVKDVSEYDTIDELKKSIADRILASHENDCDQKFEYDLLNQVIENIKVEIPEIMIETQIDRMIDEFAHSLSSQGLKFDDYLNIMGATVEEFRKKNTDTATRRVKVELALTKIAEIEALEISDEDIEKGYASLAERYNISIDKIKEFVKAKDLAIDAKLTKAAELVTSTAEVIEKTEKAASGKSRKTKKAEGETAEARPEKAKKAAVEPSGATPEKKTRAKKDAGKAAGADEGEEKPKTRKRTVKKAEE